MLIRTKSAKTNQMINSVARVGFIVVSSALCLFQSFLISIITNLYLLLCLSVTYIYVCGMLFARDVSRSCVPGLTFVCRRLFSARLARDTGNFSKESHTLLVSIAVHTLCCVSHVPQQNKSTTLA